jgi:hypothetical protein
VNLGAVRLKADVSALGLAPIATAKAGRASIAAAVFA